MHVAYLHQYFVPPGGKGGTRSYEMSRRLVAAGHRVTLITSDAFAPGSKGIEHIDGVEVRFLHVPYGNRMGFARRIRAFASFASRACLELAKLPDVDLVFATSTPLTIAIPAIAGRLAHRCPMVFEVRDLWPELPVAVGAIRNPAAIALARLLERAAYRSASRVVALSDGMRDGVVRTGYPREQVSVIPNGCDAEFGRTPTGAAELFLAENPQFARGPLITYAGTIGLINGVEYLAGIASHLRTICPEANILVVGDGACREKVALEARRLGVWQKNFWVLPPRPKPEVMGVLSATTVAVSTFVDLPQMRANSANKFFDGLAAGRPIAINHGGWQADLLRSTGAGIVLPAHGGPAAATALADFCKDAEGLSRARAAARDLAANVFDRDLLASRLIDVLEEIGSTAGARRPMVANP